MEPIHLTFLNALDVAQLAVTDDEILAMLEKAGRLGIGQRLRFA